MQFLHAATGDRDAEAKSLNVRTSGTSTIDDARLAVARAHGETEDEPTTQDHVASVGDAEHAHEQRDEREDRAAADAAARQDKGSS